MCEQKNEINGKEIENIKKSNQIKKLDKENQTAIEKSERVKNSQPNNNNNNNSTALIHFHFKAEQKYTQTHTLTNT